MTTTENIIYFATQKGCSFDRKDIMTYLSGNDSPISKRGLDTKLGRLLSSGLLLRCARGLYQLADTAMPDFVYCLSQEEKVLFSRLNTGFPFLDICIWNPNVISSFMHHIPDIGYTFIDVEKEGMEPVFHSLQQMNLKRPILLAPSPNDCEKYMTGSDSIVVRQLVGQAPLNRIEGVTVPRIEKILVDAVCDNELSFAGGSEIYTVYESVFEKYHVNKSKLLRYASRRNRKEKVEQILESISHDKS